MLDKIQKSRSKYQKKICLTVLSIIFLVAIISKLWLNHIKSLLTSVGDISTIYLLFLTLACTFYVLFGALTFSSLLVYWEESKEKNLPVLSSRIVEYLDPLTVFSFIIVLIVFYLFKEKLDSYSDVWDIMLPLVLLTVFASCFACLHNLVFSYDDVDLSISQSYDTSIGALWAVGAYTSYYKLTLEDMIEKIQAYEKEYNVTIPVKKLFIICPLSCNINGSLNKKDERIFKEGLLEIFECDQGANVNRRYKHTVYKIQTDDNEDTYVVAEYASPLGTLWEMRLAMTTEKWKYHRDCLIRNLKDLLQNYPCTVLEYDDQNPSKTEPLHRFLLSSIQKQLQERNVTMQEKLNFL